MGRAIELGKIWSFVLGFRSLVARLVPFKRESEQWGRIFLATESVNSLRISAPQWWPLKELSQKCEGRKEKCAFLTRQSVNSQQLCEFLAWESVNSSPILSRQWWRHFRLSLSLSLSLCISLSHRLYLTHNIGSASALPILIFLFFLFKGLPAVWALIDREGVSNEPRLEQWENHKGKQNEYSWLGCGLLNWPFRWWVQQLWGTGRERERGGGGGIRRGSRCQFMSLYVERE